MADQAPIEPAVEVIPLGVQVGLGPCWQPGPARWAWTKLQDQAGSDVYLLNISHGAGTTGITFSAEALRRLIATAEQQLSGLVRADATDAAAILRGLQRPNGQG